MACYGHEEEEVENTSPEPIEELEEKAIPFPVIGSGQSRLQSEFNYIGPIGKGGFGEVMKVQKLLDARVYAIKRIKLNPKNSKLTKKIVREVKLLSRLDHENVVRYYNSWVEVMETTASTQKMSSSDEEDLDDEVDAVTSSDKAIHPPVQRQSSDPKQVTFDDLPQKRLFDHFLRPGHSSSPVPPSLPVSAANEASTSEWSFSHYVPETDSERGNASDEDDDGCFGDEDNDDMFGTSFLPFEKDAWKHALAEEEEEDDSIVFQEDSLYDGEEEGDKKGQSNDKRNKQNQNISSSLSSSLEKENSDSPPKNSNSSSLDKNHVINDGDEEVDAPPPGRTEKKMQLQFLYIQMEYCDKQTLRSAIDEGSLFKDSKRLWTMFREIIEGLLHIHSQAMIHRDLKPVNIFIHSNGHLKIGDFGLATTDMISSGRSTRDVEPNPHEHFNITQQGDTLDTSDLTGHVGTAMYVAPEINSGKSTTSYNQKVDIYSLGIIFFEMCYPPLQTGMERIKVLSNLRSKEIILPPEERGFEGSTALTDPQINIIRWLLNHDPSKRPTSNELLTSDHLPPLQVEEAKAQEMIRQTMSDKKGKMYRYLVSSCLNQDMTIGQDIKYDMDLLKPLNHNYKSSLLLGREHVRDVVKRVFQRHGAIFIQSPQLLPKGNLRVYEWTPYLVKTMSRSGSVVSLPFDLRVPFARYVARTHIHSIRRYCIAPVFREARVYDVQPKEMIECAFDIISPSKEDLIADAETMVVAQEILRELNAFHKNDGDASQRYLFRLSHMKLFRGILLHFGIDDVHHNNVCSFFKDRDNVSKPQRIEQLTKIGNISEQVASNLLMILDRDGNLSQHSSALRQALRRKNQAANEIKQGLNDLEIIIEHAQSLGLELDVKISPNLVHHPDLFDGMVCQLVKRKKVKGQYSETIIAAGGRYDRLINEFSEKFRIAESAPRSKLENIATEQNTHHNQEQHGVGISFMLNHLVDKVSTITATSRDSSTSGSFDTAVAAVDVLMYSPSTLRELKSVTKRILEVTASLWNAKIRCLISDTHDTVDEAQEKAQDMGATFLVFLLDEEGMMRVRCLKEKDPTGHSFVDIEKVPTFGLIEVLQKKTMFYEKESLGSNNGSGGGSANVINPSSRLIDYGAVSSLGNVNSQNTPNTIAFNFKFLDLDRRQLSTIRKRLEVNVASKISKITNSSVNCVVLMLPFKASVIKSLASFLEIEDEARYHNSVKQLLDRHSREADSERSYKRELSKVCDEIQELRFDKDYSIIILYGNFISTDGKKTDRPKFLTTEEHVFRIIM